MAQSRSTKSSTIAGVAIVAAAAGAITALLTAPKSGKEMRTDIKTKALDSKDKVNNHTNLMKERMQNRADTLRNKAMDATDAARGTAHDMTDRVVDMTDKASTVVDQKIDKTADKAKDVGMHVDEELRRRNKE